MEKQAVRLSRPLQSVLSNFSSKKIKCWEQREIPRAEYDVNGMALDLLRNRHYIKDLWASLDAW